MTGAAATKAKEAADDLLDWLNRQSVRSRAPTPAGPLESVLDGRVAWPEADPKERKPVVEATNLAGTSRNHAVTSETFAAVPVMRLPTTDWLHHRLTITGPATEMGRFRQAAAGAGIIPWHFDLERMEEEYFHLLVAPEQRSLSVAGARIFARQLRDAVQRRHDLAVSSVGRSQTCPFDLQALIPVPNDILAFGPDEPTALAWLWENWGTTEALRHVAEESVRAHDAAVSGDGETMFRVSFWSADWTPWRALKTLRLRWTALRFDIRPTYDLP
jgi:hypothetical protein